MSFQPSEVKQVQSFDRKCCNFSIQLYAAHALWLVGENIPKWMEDAYQFNIKYGCNQAWLKYGLYASQIGHKIRLIGYSKKFINTQSFQSINGFANIFITINHKNRNKLQLYQKNKVKLKIGEIYCIHNNYWFQLDWLQAVNISNNGKCCSAKIRSYSMSLMIDNLNNDNNNNNNNNKNNNYNNYNYNNNNDNNINNDRKRNQKLSFDDFNNNNNNNNNNNKTNNHIRSNQIHMNDIDIFGNFENFGKDDNNFHFDILNKKNNEWIHDNERRKCHHCNNKFTIFNRKHHCRKCGEIFCSKHCKKHEMNNNGNKIYIKLCPKCK